MIFLFSYVDRGHNLRCLGDSHVLDETISSFRSVQCVPISSPASSGLADRGEMTTAGAAGHLRGPGLLEGLD